MLHALVITFSVIREMKQKRDSDTGNSFLYTFYSNISYK